MLLKWLTCITLFIVWHLEVVFCFGELLDWLGTCLHMFMTESLSSLDDLFIQNIYITFMPDSMLLCRSAWLWLLLFSSWPLPSLLLALTRTKRNSACVSKLLFKPVIPLESTIPSYMWYLPATPNLDFLVPSQNLFKSSLFVTVKAHGAVRETQYLPCQKYFDRSFN